MQIPPEPSATPRVRIHRVRPVDWREVRATRLAMLADTPAAYEETLADARALPDDAWQARVSGPEDRIRLAALDPAGRWVGRADLQPDAADRSTAWVLSVWADPAVRGRGSGVADALMDELLAAARATGARTVRLEVSDATPRAAAFYRRRGFRPTGRTRPAVLDPGATEHELDLAL